MTCIGAIRPGRYLTRGGKEVYIAVCSNVNADGSRNAYPWWVEDGKSGWSVDDAGKHLKNVVTAFDIVSRLDAALDAPTTGGVSMSHNLLHSTKLPAFTEWLNLAGIEHRDMSKKGDGFLLMNVRIGGWWKGIYRRHGKTIAADADHLTIDRHLESTVRRFIRETTPKEPTP